MQQRAVLKTALLSGSWVPGASTIGSQLQDGDCNRSLAKPDNPATSPHAPKTGNGRTEKQLKAEGAGGPLNATHKMPLLPTRPISKLYNLEYKESDTCASITKPLPTIIIIIIIIGRSCS